MATQAWGLLCSTVWLKALARLHSELGSWKLHKAADRSECEGFGGEVFRVMLLHVLSAQGAIRGGNAGVVGIPHIFCAFHVAHLVLWG